MTKDQLLCEKHYLACLNVLHRLREKGLLTAEEYDRVKALLLQKYNPAISSLFP